MWRSPICTLLLDALDTMARPLLERHPALLFRINSVRMTLQLDTVPSLSAVEQYARSLTAELEVIAIGRGESATSKRTKIASMAPSPSAPPKGPGKGLPAQGAGDGAAKKGGQTIQDSVQRLDYGRRVPLWQELSIQSRCRTASEVLGVRRQPSESRMHRAWRI